MGHVEVVDRGSREIVVFLSGAIDRTMERPLADAIERVTLLERINDLHRVVVDTREVTSFEEAGLRFIERLERLGRAQDFDVALSMTSPAVNLAFQRGALGK